MHEGLHVHVLCLVFMCGFGLLPSCIISSLNVLETESALLLTVTALGAAQYDSEESLKGPVY